jgi:cellulose synthase/poly-beta-1,6-N-acetylglucosamine synthase-like glycosyltransferase
MTSTAARETVRVTVAVPTYRRPQDLRALLPVLLQQAEELTASSDGRYAADVLVVDNDPDGGAAATVAELDEPRLRYTGEPEPGIAAVRNRVLDAAANSRLVAMIDDDELPHPGWLSHLVHTWESTGAAAVAGRVLAAYQGELSPWVASGDFFERFTMPTGTPVSTAAAGNLLLDIDQVRRAGLRFATDLGLSGGEDSLFSRALVRAGGRIVWCDESVAVDQVPVTRMTRRWVLARSWSHGNASVLTDLRLSGSAGERTAVRAGGLARGLVRIGLGGLRWAGGVLLRSHRHQSRGARTVLRGAGMVSGVLGVVYLEYARPGERRLRWSGVRSGSGGAVVR